MKCLQKGLSEKGLMCFVYLDDILILGDSQKQVENNPSIYVGRSLAGGLQGQQQNIHPTRNIPGVSSQPGKRQIAINCRKIKDGKELGKLVTHQSLSSIKITSILIEMLVGWGMIWSAFPVAARFSLLLVVT